MAEEVKEGQNTQDIAQSENPKEKLWKTLSDAQYYTKSYEDFDKKFSTPESVDKLYKTLNDAQYYTKTKDDFVKQFFTPAETAPVATPEEDITYGTKQLDEVGITYNKSTGEYNEGDKGLFEVKLGLGNPQQNTLTPNINNTGGFMQAINDETMRGGRYSAVKEKQSQRLAELSQMNEALTGVEVPMGDQDQLVSGDAGRDLATKIGDTLGLDALVGGFGESIYKPLGGASQAVNDLTGFVYEGITGKKYDVGDRRGIFGKLYDDSNKIYETGNTVRDQNKPTILGDVYRGVVHTLPLIAATAATGGAAVSTEAGTVISKTPEVISHLTKFLATTKALSNYGESRKEGEDIKTSLKSGVKGAFEGGAEGLTIEAQMMVGRAFGGEVVDQLVKKGLFRGGKVTQALADAVGVGTAFGATSVGRNLLNDEEVDWREGAVQFGTGIAFELPALGKAAGAEAKKAIQSSRIDAAVLKNLETKNQENKITSFLNATPEQIGSIVSTGKTYPELMADALEVGVKAGQTKDLQEKSNAYLAQVSLTNAANIKDVVDNISKSPEKFIEGIEKSNLSPEQKAEAVEKVNDVYKNFNPTEVKKTELGEKIAESEKTIQQLDEVVKNSKDPVAKTEAEVVSSEMKKGVEETQKELTQTVEQQLGLKPEEAKTPEVAEAKVATETAPKNIIEAFKGGEKGITDYREITKQKFLDHIKESRKKTSALFDPSGAKYLLEYAILSVADKSIKSGRMLASALGIKYTKQVEDIYKQAEKSAVEYAATNPDIKDLQDRRGKLLVEMQDIAKKGTGKITDPELKSLTKYAKELYDAGVAKNTREFQEILEVKTPVSARAFEAMMKEKSDAFIEKSKTTKQAPIKKAAEAQSKGGITGEVTMSNREALSTQLKTLDRGIKEGIKGGVKKTYKNISEANKDMSAILKSMLNSNAKDKISGRTYQRLVTQLSKAETFATLQTFSKTVGRVLADSKYLDKLDQVKKLQKNIKTLMNKKIPADLKARLTEMTQIQAKYVKDVDSLIDVLQQADAMLKRPTTELQTGTDLSAESNAVKALKKAEADAKKLTDEYKEARIEVLKERLEDLGVDTSVIESLYPSNPDALLQKLTESLAEAKPNLIDAYRKTSRVLLDMVKNDEITVDLTAQTAKERDYINNEVKKIDIEGIPDGQVASLTAALTNLVNYGSVSGFGDVVADSKVYLKSKETARINAIEKAVKIPVEALRRIYDLVASGTMIKDIRFKNQMAIPQLDNVSGVSDLNLNSTKYNNYVAKVKKDLETIKKANKKDLEKTLENVKLGIYADVAQYRSSWTPEQIEKEYGLRMKAWFQSLNAMEARAEKDTKYKNRYKYQMENLKAALDKIGSMSESGDVTLKMSKEELYNSLPKGQKAFYEYARTKFDEIKEDFFFNARVNSNIDIEADWQGYVPRSYSALGGNTKALAAMALEAKQINTGGSFALQGQTEVSNSGKSRTLSGDRLPQNSVLSPDFIDTFINSISKMNYDVQTQADRIYISKALDIIKSPIVQKFSDVGVFEVYAALATQKVVETVAMMGGNFSQGGFKSWVRNSYATMGKLGVAQTLGGLFAAPKQAVEIQNIAVKTDTSFALGLMALIKGEADTMEVLKLSSVEHRDAVSSEVPESGLRRQANDSKTISNVLQKLSTGTANTVSSLTDLSLKPLAGVDKLVAKVGWLSFYIDYQVKNGAKGSEISLDPKNINREAMDYANHQTSAALNESDGTQKSNFNKNLFVKTHFLFSSFAINSKMELLSNVARFTGSGVDAASRVQAGRNIVANLTGLYAFNKMSQALRVGSIYGGVALIKGIISSNVQDDKKKKELLSLIDEEQETRLLKNDVNSTKNLLVDYLYGGIGGESLGLVFNPAIDFFEEGLYTPEQLKQAEYGKAFPTNKFDQTVALLGTAGLPFKRGKEFVTSLQGATEKDEDFIIKRNGVVNADLNDVVVDDFRLSPEEKANQGVPSYSRMIDTYSAVAAAVSMSGATLQEAGNIRRLTSSIKKKLVEYDRGRIKINDVEKAIKDATVVLKIKLANGGEIPLDVEQQEVYRKVRQQTLKELTKQFKYVDFKNDFTKEEFQAELRKAVDQTASEKMGEKLKVEVEKVDTDLINKQDRTDAYRKKAIKYQK